MTMTMILVIDPYVDKCLLPPHFKKRRYKTFLVQCFNEPAVNVVWQSGSFFLFVIWDVSVPYNNNYEKSWSKFSKNSMYSIAVLHDKKRSLFEVDSCNWSILLDVIVFRVVLFIPHIVIVVVLVLILLLVNLFRRKCLKFISCYDWPVATSLFSTFYIKLFFSTIKIYSTLWRCIIFLLGWNIFTDKNMKNMCLPILQWYLPVAFVVFLSGRCQLLGACHDVLVLSNCTPIDYWLWLTINGNVTLKVSKIAFLFHDAIIGRTLSLWSQCLTWYRCLRIVFHQQWC